MERATSSSSAPASPASRRPGTCATATCSCSRHPTASAAASASEPRGEVLAELRRARLRRPGFRDRPPARGGRRRGRDLPGRLAAVAIGGAIVASGGVETYPFRLPLSWRTRAGARPRRGSGCGSPSARYARGRRRATGEPAAGRQRACSSSRTTARSRSASAGCRPTSMRSSAHAEPLVRRARGARGRVRRRLLPPRLGSRGRPLSRHRRWPRPLHRRARSRPRRPRAARRGGRPRSCPTATESSSRRRRRHGEDDRPTPSSSRPRLRRRRGPAGPPETDGRTRRGPLRPVRRRRVPVDETGPMPWHDLYALATPDAGSACSSTPRTSLARRGPGRRGGSLMVYARPPAQRGRSRASTTRRSHAASTPTSRTSTRGAGRMSETVIQRWSRGTPYPPSDAGGSSPRSRGDLGPSTSPATTSAPGIRTRRAERPRPQRSRSAPAFPDPRNCAISFVCIVNCERERRRA